MATARNTQTKNTTARKPAAAKSPASRSTAPKRAASKAAPGRGGAQAATSERFEGGLRTRREVLGSEYVDAALNNADDWTRPFQQLLTETAWNDVWNRPGLDRRTRSIINLAILGTLGRSTELGSHVRGALRNGVTPEEIREVFIHMMGYAGYPAGVEAFRTAQPIVAAFREQQR